jgi:hypothetical protein
MCDGHLLEEGTRAIAAACLVANLRRVCCKEQHTPRRRHFRICSSSGVSICTFVLVKQVYWALFAHYAVESDRLHTPAYASIRQHTSAYVSIPMQWKAAACIRQHTPASVSIRQHTSAYLCSGKRPPAYASIRQHPSAYASIRQHTYAVESGRQSCLRKHYIVARVFGPQTYVRAHELCAACSSKSSTRGRGGKKRRSTKKKNSSLIQLYSRVTHTSQRMCAHTSAAPPAARDLARIHPHPHPHPHTSPYIYVYKDI